MEEQHNPEVQMNPGEGGEHPSHDEVTTEDVVDHNNFLLTALIDTLIEKGIFTKEEFENRLDRLEAQEDHEEFEESQ